MYAHTHTHTHTRADKLTRDTGELHEPDGLAACGRAEAGRLRRSAVSHPPRAQVRDARQYASMGDTSVAAACDQRSTVMVTVGNRRRAGRMSQRATTPDGLRSWLPSPPTTPRLPRCLHPAHTKKSIWLQLPSCARTCTYLRPCPCDCAASGKHRSIGAVRAQATDEKPHAPSSTATNMDLLHLNHVRNARVARF